jgi:hypothetical protein
VSSLRQIYTRSIAFWHHELERRRPTAIIIHGTPHQGHDLVLYELAKRRGIPTLLVDRTSLDELLFFRRSLEDSPNPAPGSGRGAARVDDNLQALNAQLNSLAALRQDLRPDKALRRAARMIAKGRMRQPALEPAFGTNPHMPTKARVATTDIIQTRARRDLFRRYEAMSQPLAASGGNSQVVFVPLHFQPERTTLPNAGVFRDQVLLCETLARHLPDGWRLLVKEHPRQFSNRLNVTRFRAPEDYERIAALPNTSLLAIETPSSEVAAMAGAVATATGSAGWEAIQMGTPALVFGFPWYAHAPGVTPVRNEQSIAAATRRLDEGGLHADAEEVARWASSLSECCFRGVFSDRTLAQKAHERSSIVESFSEALLQELNSGGS